MVPPPQPTAGPSRPDAVARPGTGPERGTEPGTEPVVRAERLTKRWGTHTVFAEASFAIHGGVTGLLGANGSGKTTLLGMLLGLHRPDGGTLRVNGLDPDSAGPEVRARIGYSPEHHDLPPELRAHDLVRHVGELHGLARADATSRANDVLWQVGLGEERFRALSTMSTGQRQRVKLAQAIVHDPLVALLDEPTDGLDPTQRDEMLALIRRVGTEFGIDVIISSHLLEEVEKICDAVVILSGGTVAASGSIGQLTGAGLGIVVDLDATPDALAAIAARLEAIGAAVHRPPEAPGRLVVSTPEGGTLTADVHDALRDAVVAEDAGIRRLSSATTRLEDVFWSVAEAGPP